MSTSAYALEPENAKARDSGRSEHRVTPAGWRTKTCTIVHLPAASGSRSLSRGRRPQKKGRTQVAGNLMGPTATLEMNETQQSHTEEQQREPRFPHLRSSSNNQSIKTDQHKIREQRSKALSHSRITESIPRLRRTAVAHTSHSLNRKSK